MPKRYRVEVELVLEEEDGAKAIAIARRHYAERSSDTEELEDGTTRDIRTDAVVSDLEDAVMELILNNQSLESAGIAVEVICLEEVAKSEPAPSQRDAVEDGDRQAEIAGESESMEDDLDVFETGVYLCRWPNGEFSVVKADSRREALLELDEWAGAYPASLFPMESCMIDFRLDDLGEIELYEFGEETGQFIWETCYPELHSILSSNEFTLDGSRENAEVVKEKIKQAVNQERQRLWDNQPEGPEAETELGRELQRRLGTVGPVADHYVRETAKRILRSKLGEDGKPN